MVVTSTPQSYAPPPRGVGEERGIFHHTEVSEAEFLTDKLSDACSGAGSDPAEISVLVKQLAKISARLYQITCSGALPVDKRCSGPTPTSPTPTVQAQTRPVAPIPCVHPLSPTATGDDLTAKRLPPLQDEAGIAPQGVTRPSRPLSAPSGQSRAAQLLQERFKRLQESQVVSNQALSKIESANMHLKEENVSLNAQIAQLNAALAAQTEITEERKPGIHKSKTNLRLSIQSNAYERALDVLEEEPPCGGPPLKGAHAVAAFHKMSEDILAEMHIRQATAKESSWRQDVMYQNMGVKGLIRQGRRIKTQFDRFGEALAKLTESEFHASPLKSVERAEPKTKVSYCGDCTRLKDVVRGMLIFKGTKPGALGRLYTTIRRLCLEGPALSAELGEPFEVVSFKDRLQNPIMGGYRDALCTLSINGYICELQLNLAEVLHVKDSLGHKEYEFLRLAIDELICACADNNTAKAQLNLKVLKNALGAADPTEPTSWLETRDLYEATCLHYAAFQLNPDLVEGLLAAKADVLAEDCNGRLPLELASSLACPEVHPEATHGKTDKGDQHVLLKLMECMAGRERGAFRHLSRRGMESVLRVFDLHGGDDHRLLSPHWPAQCSEFATRIFGRLYRSSTSALIAAAEAGFSGIIKYVQRSGTPVNSALLNPNQFIVTALDSAILGGQPAVASMLVEEGGKFWSMGNYHCEQLKGIVQNELEWGLHVDLQAAAERYAAAEDRLSLQRLRTLLALSSSANVNAKKVLEAAVRGRGPLRGLTVLLLLSQWCGRVGIPRESSNLLSSLLEQAVEECTTKESVYKVRAVLDCGDAGERVTTDALWSATSLGRPAAIRMLLDAKANPAAGGLWGNTPLHNLCLVGQDPDSVELLLQRRADPSATNLAGKSPLHFVAIGIGKCTLTIAKLLVDANAGINERVMPSKEIEESLGFHSGEPYYYEVGSGQTALHFAAKHSVAHRAVPLVKFCLENKADPNCTDSHRRTPMHLACKAACPELVQSLLEAKARTDMYCHEGDDVLSPRHVVQREMEHPWYQQNKPTLDKLHAILHKVSAEELEDDNINGKTPGA